MKFNNIPRGVAGGLIAAAALAAAVPATVSAEEFVLTAANWGHKQTAAVQAAGGSIVWRHERAGIGVVSADADFLSRVAGSNAFQSSAADRVVHWQPDTVSSEAITPGDETFFPFQWNLQSMNAPAAWAGGCTGAGARVAVIDGGIYDLHADLAPNLDTQCSASFVPGQPYNTDTGDFWHGTHVAGIVAAADNGFGVIGVAPEAELMHVKALHDGSGSFGQIIGAILYASDPAAFGVPQCQRADVINMSLGAIFAKAGGAGPLVGAMNQAVNYAAQNGVLVVSSAGNEGVDMRDYPSVAHTPSDAGSGLSISATGPVDFANGGTDFRRPASYSNYGNGTVAVAAPGGDYTLAPVGSWFLDMVISTCRGDTTPPDFSFCFAAGTSMASPAAAGVAALIVGNNPGISLGALKSRLLQSADDEGPIGNDAFYGHGFVNAHNACMM